MEAEAGTAEDPAATGGDALSKMGYWGKFWEIVINGVLTWEKPFFYFVFVTSGAWINLNLGRFFGLMIF